MELQETKTPRDLALLNYNTESYRDLLKMEFAWTRAEQEKIIDSYDFEALPDPLKRPILKDFELMKSLTVNKNSFNRPTVGDFIKINGELKRLCIYHDTYDFDFQESERGSFHLSKGGYSSFSGTCGEIVNVKGAKHTGSKIARFWMWHEGSAGPHRGIEINIPVKVWTIEKSALGSDEEESE